MTKKMGSVITSIISMVPALAISQEPTATPKKYKETNVDKILRPWFLGRQSTTQKMTWEEMLLESGRASQAKYLAELKRKRKRSLYLLNRSRAEYKDFVKCHRFSIQYFESLK